jgi:hypothetical protein
MAIRREMQFTGFDRAVTKLLQAASVDDHPIRMQRGRILKVRFANSDLLQLVVSLDLLRCPSVRH